MKHEKVEVDPHPVITTPGGTVLINISAQATSLGMENEIWVSSSVWESYIAWTDGDSQKQFPLSQEGREWALIQDIERQCKGMDRSRHREIEIYVIPRDGHSQAPKRVRLKCSIQESALWVMQTNED